MKALILLTSSDHDHAVIERKVPDWPPYAWGGWLNCDADMLPVAVTRPSQGGRYIAVVTMESEDDSRAETNTRNLERVWEHCRDSESFTGFHTDRALDGLADVATLDRQGHRLARYTTGNITSINELAKRTARPATSGETVELFEQAFDGMRKEHEQTLERRFRKLLHDITGPTTKFKLDLEGLEVRRNAKLDRREKQDARDFARIATGLYEATEVLEVLMQQMTNAGIAAGPGSPVALRSLLPKPGQAAQPETPFQTARAVADKVAAGNQPDLGEIRTFLDWHRQLIDAIEALRADVLGK